MSLDFTKVNYIDGSTIIEADNLNDIQDAILELDNNKVEAESGKGLSTEDYTSAEKAKLSGIEAGAQVNPGNATTSADGLMSSVDKAKLNGIASGATAVTIDSTLTVAGQAADAKATGDALAEKYEKPSGGIPKTDLASAVQTSLNKADAAIRLGLTGASVGDLVRVAAVDTNGKPTSWRKAPLCDITTNPNLLDNWYFVGGGSQQGDGIFPINQRGKTVYPGAGDLIDRWNSSNANGTLTITQDTVTLSASSSGNAFFRQLVKNLPSNTAITVSALIRGSGAGVLRVDNEAGTSTIFNAQSYNNPGSAWTLISGSGTLPDGIGIVTLRANTSTAIDIAAIKCEFGTEQTLAHQEGGVWVLNEIPDFTEELAKCGAYNFTEDVTFPAGESPGSWESFTVLNNVVFINLQTAVKAHAMNDVLFTLPAKYAPSNVKCFTVIDVSTGGAAGIRINANGQGVIAAIQGSPTGRLLGSISYIIRT